MYINSVCVFVVYVNGLPINQNKMRRPGCSFQVNRTFLNIKLYLRYPVHCMKIGSLVRVVYVVCCIKQDVTRVDVYAYGSMYMCKRWIKRSSITH